jgi:hypothetical protein
MAKHPPELVTLIIQAQTTPFQDDPPYADDFYMAVGRVVLLWGKLEQNLDFLVVTAINVEARNSKRRLFKVPLGPKLELFRSIYSDCKELRPLKAEAHVLAKAIEDLGEQRHLIVHSNWLGFDDGPPQKLRMRHVGHRKGMITISNVNPSMDDLSRLSVAFHTTRSRIVSLHLQTGELVDPAIWEKAQEQARAGANGVPPIEL